LQLCSTFGPVRARGSIFVIDDGRRSDGRSSRRNRFRGVRNKREIGILPDVNRRVGAYRRCNCGTSDDREQPKFEASGLGNHWRLSIHWRSGSHGPLGRRFNKIETRQTEVGGAPQKDPFGPITFAPAETLLTGALGSVGFTIAIRHVQNQSGNQPRSLSEEVLPNSIGGLGPRGLT
jgi:hypothetical protein